MKQTELKELLENQKKQIEDLKHRVSFYSSLIDVSIILSSTFDLEELIRRVMGFHPRTGAGYCRLGGKTRRVPGGTGCEKGQTFLLRGGSSDRVRDQVHPGFTAYRAGQGYRGGRGDQPRRWKELYRRRLQTFRDLLPGCSGVDPERANA